MARLSLSLCAAAALVTAACTPKVAPPEPARPGGVQLIPAEATVLAGVDLGRLVESEIFGLFRDDLRKTVPQVAWIDALDKCGRRPADVRLSLTIGSDGHDEALVVALGEGIGDRTFLECLIAERTHVGQPPFKLADPAPAAPPDAPIHATIVDPRTVVFTTRAWTHHVADRLAGRGVAALDGPMQAQFARADRTATLWFVGRTPEALGRALEPAMGAALKDILGSVDLSGGVRVDVSGSVASPELAASLHKQAQDTLSMIRGMLPMVGLGQKTIETIRLDATGAELRLGFAVPLDEVMKLAKMMAPATPQPPDDPQVQTARTAVLTVGDAYARFRADKPEGCPNAVELRNAGVLDVMPRDPWGAEIVVVCPGKHGPIDIASPGPDGVLGNDDDVTNWN